jgi:hypothetical protein
VPRSAPEPPEGLRVARLQSIGDALRVTRVMAASSAVAPEATAAHVVAGPRH